MSRALPALVLLLCSLAWGQAPAYSAAGIVNAANFAPGPFAANSVVSIFGNNLSNNAAGVAANQAGGVLPTQLVGANVSVYVENLPAPLLYVSPGQINFLIPTNLTPGKLSVTVVKQGIHGPPVDVTLVPGAPALFSESEGYVLAADWNHAGAVITQDAPARPGDMVIVYATGMGSAGHNPTGLVPSAPAQIDNLAALKIYLDDKAVDPLFIKYAGLTPGFAGLYQINLELPLSTGTDPKLRVAIGDQSSPDGLKLAVR